MRFLNNPERTFLQAVSELAYANPFLPDRTVHERRALGSDFVPSDPVWSVRVENPEEPRVNAWRIHERMEALAPDLRQRLSAGATASEADLILYEDAVLYLLTTVTPTGFTQPRLVWRAGAGVCTATSWRTGGASFTSPASTCPRYGSRPTPSHALSRS